MKVGIITMKQGLRLLQLYGLPVSKGPQVYAGEMVKPQKTLW